MNTNTLTKSQKLAFEYYRNGENLFIHGSAGSGKSFLIERIVEDSKKRGKEILVCAPTGKAAVNVNGMTIHSAFKVARGIVNIDEIFPGRRINPRDEESILDTADIIIIDEISMVRFDLFEGIVRSVKSSKQLIIFGDFYQLPPVLTDKEKDAYEKTYEAKIFAFESLYFKNFTVIELKEIVRQKDEEFVNILNSLRRGDSQYLKKFTINKKNENAITLVATNREVDDINSAMMRRLQNHSTYEAICEGKVSTDDMFADEILTLAPGAKVIFTCNDKYNRFINGTEAKIVRCGKNDVEVEIDGIIITIEPVKVDITEPKLVEYIIDGKRKKRIENVKVGSFSQLPLRLAWAITIHKSQGMSLSQVNINPARCFAHGQLYVAISRCRTLEGVTMLVEPHPDHLICNQKVRDFMDSLTYPAKNIADKDINDTPKKANKEVVEPIEPITEQKKKRLLLRFIDWCRGLIKRLFLPRTKPPQPEQEKAQVVDKVDKKKLRSSRKIEVDAAFENYSVEVKKRLAPLTIDTQAVYLKLYNLKNENDIVNCTGETLSGETHIPKRTVEACLKTLRDNGLIERSSKSKKFPGFKIMTEQELKDTSPACQLMKTVDKNLREKICKLCEKQTECKQLMYSD